MSASTSILAVVLLLAPPPCHSVINRGAVLARHDLHLTAIHPADVITLGNGAFAYNVDATGLQSLNATYTAAPSFDLQILSDWGFHTTPFSTADPAFPLRRFNYTQYSTPTGAHSSRAVHYPTNSNVSTAAYNWLHSNPHRVNLAQLALRWGDGSSLTAGQVSGLNGTLTLATGVYSSLFTLTPSRGAALDVSVVSAVHPDADVLSTRLTCVPRGGGDASCPLALRLAFPYARGGNPSAGDWDPRDDALHVTVVEANVSDGRGGGAAVISRTKDADGYTVACNWTAVGSPSLFVWTLVREGPHVLSLKAANATSAGRPSAPSAPNGAPLQFDQGASLTDSTDDSGAAAAASAFSIELVCVFAPRGVVYPTGGSSAWLTAKAALTVPFVALPLPAALPPARAVEAASAASFSSYWATGAFVDLASAAGGGADGARALELERRVLLSQYLLRVHSAGATPPQVGE